MIAVRADVTTPTPTPTLTIRSYVFYHHSSGGYIWYNDLRHVPLRVHDLAPEIPDLEWNQDTDAPAIYDNNSPQEYYNYWYDPNTSDHGNAKFHEQMNRYSNGQPNAMMFEFGYTTDQIDGPSYLPGNIPTGGNPSQDVPNLLNYAAAMRSLRTVFNNHPDKVFLIWTATPVAQGDTYGTNQVNADNARRFANWLKDRGPNGFLGEDPTQVQVHNVYVFDEFDFLAKTDNPYDSVCGDADGCSNRLAPDYWNGQNSSDSHPNPHGQQTIALPIAQWIVDSLRDYDNFHAGITPTPSSIPTPTDTPTATPTPGGPTNTPTPTNTPVPTNTPTPTRTPTPTPSPTNTPTPTPTGTILLNFNDLAGDNSSLITDTSHPPYHGIINWGVTRTLLTSPAWRKMTTRNLSYTANNTVTTFSFVDQNGNSYPRIFMSLKIFNGGSSVNPVTVRCDNGPQIQFNVAANQLLTAQTGWSTTCNSVTLTSPNSDYTNYDDFSIQ